MTCLFIYFVKTKWKPSKLKSMYIKSMNFDISMIVRELEKTIRKIYIQIPLMQLKEPGIPFLKLQGLL